MHLPDPTGLGCHLQEVQGFRKARIQIPDPGVKLVRCSLRSFLLNGC